MIGDSGLDYQRVDTWLIRYVAPLRVLKPTYGPGKQAGSVIVSPLTRPKWKLHSMRLQFVLFCNYVSERHDPAVGWAILRYATTTAPLVGVDGTATFYPLT